MPALPRQARAPDVAGAGAAVGVAPGVVVGTWTRMARRRAGLHTTFSLFVPCPRVEVRSCLALVLGPCSERRSTACERAVSFAASPCLGVGPAGLLFALLKRLSRHFRSRPGVPIVQAEDGVRAQTPRALALLYPGQHPPSTAVSIQSFCFGPRCCSSAAGWCVRAYGRSDSSLTPKKPSEADCSCA